MRRTIPDYVLFTDDEFLAYYRRNAKQLYKSGHKRITDTKILRRVITCLFETIGEHLINNIGGVYLKRLGYFGIWRSATPLVISKNYNSISLNGHSDGYQYVLDFFPDVTRTRALHGWVMDRMFNNIIKKKLYFNLKKGIRYKNYYYILKDSIKNKLTI